MNATCPGCGADVPTQARFCAVCGNPVQRCSECAVPLPAEAAFCMACGTPAGGDRVVPSAVTSTPPSERRLVSVLFADLSGYTRVSETLDPEVVGTIVDRSLRRLAAAVTAHGGTVDKYAGDNVMAVFGAPVSHEDDAERAVLCGLAMQRVMDNLNRELRDSHRLELPLRVGVNTGEVLAGSMAGVYTVTGDAVNVAARLQGVAHPGGVLVGGTTRLATAARFEYRGPQRLEIKGKAQPVEAWEAVAPRGAEEQAPRRDGPLIGRDDELSLLLSLARRTTTEGRPHLVTVRGEPGVGKSRLLGELTAALAQTTPAPRVRRGRCVAYGTGVAYWALGEIVRAEAGIGADDSSEEAWTKLADRVGELRPPREPADRAQARARLVARLLNIDAGPSERPDDTDPQRAREASFAAVRTLLEHLAAERPLVLALEDIHWADQGMLDLVEYLVRWVQGPLLIVCMTREELFERRPAWGTARGRTTSLVLGPLSAAQMLELTGVLLPDRPELIARIAQRASGNALFAEELVRRLGQEETVSPHELPSSLQTLLTARLDALPGPVRELVQLAAVVGRTFSLDLVARLVGAPADEVGVQLEELEDREILVPCRLAADEPPEYMFKHVLVRDAAYSTLPMAERCARHFDAARAIEAGAGDRLEEVLALRAEHDARAAELAHELHLPADQMRPIEGAALASLEAAGDAEAAICSYHEALSHYGRMGQLDWATDPTAAVRGREKEGDVAHRLGRSDAAVSAWTCALEAHERLADSEAVARLHRKLGVTLGHVGHTADALAHLRQGIAQLRDGPPSVELVRLYEEAATLYTTSGDNMLAIYAGEKALRVGDALAQPQVTARAHRTFGRIYGRLGHPRAARDHLERSVELAREHDPYETIGALQALAEHLELVESDLAQATARASEALVLACELGDVPARIELETWLGALAAIGADWTTALACAASSRVLAEREGLATELAHVRALEALLAWRDGRAAEAAALLDQALRTATDSGWTALALRWRRLLAVMLLEDERVDRALDELAAVAREAERAGQLTELVLATTQRAAALALAGRHEHARSSLAIVTDLADRLPYPVIEAAALEARGVADPADGGGDALLAARERWRALDRPLDGALCALLAGELCAAFDPQAATRALKIAREDYVELEMPALAARAATVRARVGSAA